MSAPVPGGFSVYNTLAAASTAVSLGLPLVGILDALKTFNGVKGRIEVVPTGRDFSIIIDYAHTPDALEKILKSVKSFANGRVVALFGCGGDRDRTKRPLMGKIAAQNADYLIVTSDNPRSEEPMSIINEIVEGIKGERTKFVTIESRIEAIRYAILNAKAGDLILLAGKGHEDYQIIKTGKIHLDEREVISDVLKELAAAN
jgi:UDP-N-acetylmuramoyl-L-alanyl-D-glutamate--2,6-diaminopimelate ligase